MVCGGLARPARARKACRPFLKVCFLNFNMYFKLKSHNFKGKSKSMYKLSCFATGRINFDAFS